jgi:hypothetical protein
MERQGQLDRVCAVVYVATCGRVDVNEQDHGTNKASRPRANSFCVQSVGMATVIFQRLVIGNSSSGCLVAGMDIVLVQAETMFTVAGSKAPGSTART